jgi:hypothetical protein
MSPKETSPVSKRVALQSDEAPKTRLAGDLRIYAYYARAAGWNLAFYLCCQATTTFLMKFPDVRLRWWSAGKVSHPGDWTGFYLGVYCMFAGLALCSMVIGILAPVTGVMPRASASRETFGHGDVRSVFLPGSNRFRSNSQSVGPSATELAFDLTNGPIDSART